MTIQMLTILLMVKMTWFALQDDDPVPLPECGHADRISQQLLCSMAKTSHKHLLVWLLLLFYILHNTE